MDRLKAAIVEPGARHCGGEQRVAAWIARLRRSAHGCGVSPYGHSIRRWA